MCKWQHSLLFKNKLKIFQTEKNIFQMNNPSINKKIDKFYLSDNKKIFQTEVLIAIVMFWLLFLILCCVCEMVSELNKDFGYYQ